MCATIAEPTNNIPPKVPGKKYEGGEIVARLKGSDVYLMCQVIGFPVPFFR